MQLTVTIESAAGEAPRAIAIGQLVIAGWAGRDAAAIEHHIAELAAIGVPRPSAVPLFYRVAANQLVQDPVVQVVGTASAGEVEPFVFADHGTLYVTVASDHTDRGLERTSVALAKQVCAKPVATRAWPLAEVAAHWDDLVLRATIAEEGREVLYQEAPVSALRTPTDLIDRVWRPRAEEQLEQRRHGRPMTHRVSRLDGLSLHSARLLGPLQGLVVDG